MTERRKDETMTKATEATRNGVTVKVVCFTHDDYSQAFNVEISKQCVGMQRNERQRVIIPSFTCRDETGARKLANLAYQATKTTDDIYAIRDAATANLRVIR